MLTAREREILQLLADGMSNQDVAAKLFISQETVKSHVRHILAKLEADTRTLAFEAGRRWGVRINAISAGPIRTLAGAGITDARYMFAFQQRHSPLGRGVTLEELGGAGLYLLSDLSTGVTGEIHFVDSGYNVIAMPQPDALKANGVDGNGGQ